MNHIRAALLSLCLGIPLPALAHELWIDPERFMIEPSTRLSAHIRVGENFEGAPMSWLPKRFPRTEILQANTSVPLQSRLGDRPAITATPPHEGLTIITVETLAAQITYREWKKFQKFVTHKDFKFALAEHADRGLPQTGFAESYTRHVKALVAVGSGEGQDRVIGLETELIALSNPYTDDLSGGLPVQLLYLGTPRADAQIEVFEKDVDSVKVFTIRTDDTGVGVIPVKPGKRYLLDAVVLRGTGVDSPSEGAVWETLWAGLSFATP